MKRPSFQFYPGDWRRDPGVQALDFHDRGVWFEILCLMHESDYYGALSLNGRPMPLAAASRILGLPEDELESTIQRLLDYGVATQDDDGFLICRRMIRDERERQGQREAGKKGGNPALTGGYNKPGFLYAMQRASDGAIKIGISQSPQKRLYKIRYQQKQPVEMLAFSHVDDMGVAEARMHERFADKKDGEWFVLNRTEIDTLLSALKGNDKGKQTPSSSSSSSSSTSVDSSARDARPRPTEATANVSRFARTQESDPSIEPDQPPRRRTNVSVEHMLESLPGLSEPVAQDYLVHRKSKRAPLTETAWNGICRNIAKAQAPPDDALTLAMARGWQGFEPGWWANAQRQTGGADEARQRNPDGSRVRAGDRIKQAAYDRIQARRAHGGGLG